MMPTYKYVQVQTRVPLQKGKPLLFLRFEDRNISCTEVLSASKMLYRERVLIQMQETDTVGQW